MWTLKPSAWVAVNPLGSNRATSPSANPPEVLLRKVAPPRTAQPLPNRQRLLPLPPLLRPSAPGVPCWVAWPLAWAWPGWPALLGLGAEFAQFLLIALVALAVVAVIGMVMRARRSGAANQSGASPFAFQGAGASNPAAAQAPHTYRPENVGNDASARPGSAAAWRLTLRAKPRVRAW